MGKQSTWETKAWPQKRGVGRGKKFRFKGERKVGDNVALRMKISEASWGEVGEGERELEKRGRGETRLGVREVLHSDIGTCQSGRERGLL